MDFLERVLHINVEVDKINLKYSLPNFILSRYLIYSAHFNGQKVFLLYTKTELDKIQAVKNHVQKVQGIEKIPVVIVLDKITARQRQNFIDAGIPFVVENKQCYLPFMGIVLTEKCDAPERKGERLSPSAQLLLFYYIEKNQKELYINEMVEAFGLSAMTISRAVRCLEQASLITSYKKGVLKVITSEYSGRKLFEKAKKYLVSPIKHKCYILKSVIDNNLFVAGEQALSMHSMLNSPRINCYATINVENYREYISDDLMDETNQVELQVWKYAPNVLAQGTVVDVLSLASCFINDTDERVEDCVDEMLDAYWREING